MEQAREKATKEDVSGKGLIVTRHKPLGLQVCVPEGWEQAKIEREANLTVPCGTTHGWVLSESVENPVVCESDDTRQHWVLTA